MLRCRRFCISGGTMQRIVLRSLVVLAFVITTASAAIAQITAATISGTIKDVTGGVLPGADVVAKNLETGLSRSTVSNGDGAFTLAGLAPGKYEVRVGLPGFNTSAQTVELTVAQQAGLTVTLKLGSAQESETVTAGGGATATKCQPASPPYPRANERKRARASAPPQSNGERCPSPSATASSAGRTSATSATRRRSSGISTASRSAARSAGIAGSSSAATGGCRKTSASRSRRRCRTRPPAPAPSAPR